MSVRHDRSETEIEVDSNMSGMNSRYAPRRLPKSNSVASAKIDERDRRPVNHGVSATREYRHGNNKEYGRAEAVRARRERDSSLSVSIVIRHE